MTTARQWWRRAAAAIKDRRSLYLTHVAALRPAASSLRRSHPELEAAVIRATSHDERSMDYASAARVFALARASPPAMQPLMWALARRAGRTRCWAVALKSLMLAHGLLLRSDDLSPRAAASRLGRVPFDLGDFRDPSSSPEFSAFVRAYFRFLDTRSLFAAQEELDAAADDVDDEEDARLDRVRKQQHLLDLLMEVRPYGDGMEKAGLILEAMDCVVIEIFEVYSKVCTGIARFLVGVLGSAPTTPAAEAGGDVMGMRVLRKAAEQSVQLSSYFELCRGLGVLNAAEFPAVERVPEDDIRDLEKIMMSHVVVVEDGGNKGEEEKEAKVLVAVEDGDEKEKKEAKALVAVEETGMAASKTTVVTKEWVVFDDGDDNGGGGGARQGHFGGYVNPFVVAPWDAVAGSRDLLV
nr:unnamed protein product [Digitaria exilis]